MIQASMVADTMVVERGYFDRAAGTSPRRVVASSSPQAMATYAVCAMPVLVRNFADTDLCCNSYGSVSPARQRGYVVVKALRALSTLGSAAIRNGA